MSVWETNLRLEAFKQGRAIPRVSRRRVVIEDHARMLCPLRTAGWDPYLHGVAFGGLSHGTETLTCGDPTSWEEQVELMAKLAVRFQQWFDQCYADGEGEVVPQIVVPNQAAAKTLLGLADRLTWLPIPERGKMKEKTQAAQKLGRLLQYYVRRMEVDGQQSVVSASGYLAQHLAIGQDPTDHLGAWMCWLDPQDGDDPVALQALQAEQQMLGIRTTPEFDQQLQAKVQEYLKPGSPGLRSARQRAIQDLLKEVFTQTVTAVKQGLAYVEDMNLEPLAALEVIRNREVREFHRFMAHEKNDGRFAKQDNPRMALYRLAIMEDATEQWKQAQIWGDPVTLAQACLEGDVLAAKVTAHRGTSCTLVSEQSQLRVRSGDTLQLMSNPAPGRSSQLLVQRVTRVGARCEVQLQANAEEHLPPISDQIQYFASQPPSWNMLGINLKKISRRLQNPAITHAHGHEGPPQIPAMIDNPLDALKELAR